MLTGQEPRWQVGMYGDKRGVLVACIYLEINKVGLRPKDTGVRVKIGGVASRYL